MMKKALLILVAVFSLNYALPVSAQRGNSSFTKITLTSAGRKDPSYKGNGPATRSIAQPILAYVCNNAICINFNIPLSSATINIINEQTGKTIHEESFNDPANININLDGESNGSFLIEIELDGIHMFGSFELY